MKGYISTSYENVVDTKIDEYNETVNSVLADMAEGKELTSDGKSLTIQHPNEIYIGADLPVNSDATIWIDTDEDAIVQSATSGANVDLTPYLKTSELSAQLLAKIYPVGSIYMSVNSADPATFIGGTWERLRDRFLLAAGDSYAPGAQGGEVNHMLVEEELPNIKGTFLSVVPDNHASKTTGHFYGIGESVSDNYLVNTNVKVNGAGTNYGYGYSFGNNVAHNNMPPYLAVYIWQRIA